ncbi:MAG: glucose-6-phosphate 1-epimerase [Pseudohongiellaceae bacterium]|jgi:glucose-6-phosphate 1-epimerase
MSLNAFNAQYGIPGFIEFKQGVSGFTFAHIKNCYGSAEISLYGGQVTHFQLLDDEPILWMSPLSQFIPGKAIRGGIPICWPWFGPHPNDSGLPQHGIARISHWSLVDACLLEGEHIRVVLRCDQDKIDQLAEWKGVELELSVTLGKTLRLDLCTRNRRHCAIAIGGALHSYFRVEDIDQVVVQGLEARHYRDKLDNYKRKFQQKCVVFTGETDREYLDTKSDCILIDKAKSRSLRVSKEGSATTVIWNPWQLSSQKMADFSDDGYREMVCIEAAITANDAQIISPGKSHILSQTIALI